MQALEENEINLALLIFVGSGDWPTAIRVILRFYPILTPRL